MSFTLKGIMLTASDLDATLLERRRTLELRRAEAIHALAEQRLKDELAAEAKQQA